MKFMKLGSRPDTFHTTEAVRSVSCEISSDVIIQVKGSRYLLHKFPLLSKCLRLQKLCSESSESSPIQSIKLPDFPGGAEAFELCAKFCYGITITLSAYNIVSTLCAAHYLQMTEDLDKGNLVYKVEVFFNSCILNGWRDSIVTLQTTKAFPLASEELKVTPRCIEAIASKVLSSNGSERCDRRSRGWWGEDLAELGIDLYWRVMLAIKSSKKVPNSLIGDALRVYVSKWLPNLPKSLEREGELVHDFDERDSKHRIVLESIVSLLPSQNGVVSCSFLLKLLKASNILNASFSTKRELAKRISLQLDEAAVSDLLLPQTSSSESDTKYDVDLVITIFQEFMSIGHSPVTSPKRVENRVSRAERRKSRSAEDVDFDLQERRRSSFSSHSSKLKVAKLVDGFLQEMAKDKNLPMSKFISIAEVVPQFARVNHDDLYKAIDIYLKGHLEMNKREKKRLCRILDCKKLSLEASRDAAQNEMLPLRVVVQVLFFEQARASMAGGRVSRLASNAEKVLEGGETPSQAKASFSTTATMTPSRGRRLLSKLWPISRSRNEKN